MTKIMGYWLRARRLRIPDGRRAVHHRGKGSRRRQEEARLRPSPRDARQFLQWRCRDAVLLAEANVPPDESLEYFGDEGDRLQLMLNFPVNQRLFYALASEDIGPLVWALQQTREAALRTPSGCTSFAAHDELDLGRLSPEQRATVFAAFAPDKSMQLYDRGIRRRLAPMLEQRSPPTRAGVQPAVLAAGHADDAVRRRDRHGRRPHDWRSASARGPPCSGRTSRTAASRAPSAPCVRSSTTTPTATRRSTWRSSAAIRSRC